MSAYDKDFDTLLAEILADYQNLDSAPDISQGSITFIKGACLASALWSLYKYNDWLSKQQFPDQADSNNRDHWGTIYGIPRLTGETDDDYGKRIISLLQQPSAGGTAKDYFDWAKAAVPSPGIPANIAETFLPAAVDVGGDRIMLDGTTNSLGWVDQDPILFTSSGTLPSPLVAGTQYYAIRRDTTAVQPSLTAGGAPIDLAGQGTGLHQVYHATQSTDPNSFYVENVSVITPNSTPVPTQPGTVTLVIVPSDEAILDPAYLYHPATAALLTTVSDYVDARRPVTAGINSVAMESTSNYSIVMACSPVTINTTTISNDVFTYVNSLTPGAVLYKVQLESIALRDGAINAVVTTPTFDVYGQIIPDSTTAIRTSSVTINVS